MMPILVLIIVGIAAGFVATKVMKSDVDMITTIVIGIFGAMIGGLILRFLLLVTGFMAGFVGAVLGAMLLIWLWRIYGPKR